MTQPSKETLASRLRRSAVLGLFALLVYLVCGSNLTSENVAPVASRLEPSRRVVKNGLVGNGLFQNGLFQNGLFQNGLFLNGLFEYDVWQGPLLQNNLWQDAFWQQSPAALEILRTNAYAPQVLHYLYECAMTPAQSTVLDPGPVPEHANVELRGAIGLTPAWGEPGGTCDESCQRWLTACLLARTNAYGVEVVISMRAPDDAPGHIKEALAVTNAERDAYPLREAAFYGNLFRQEEQPDGTTTMAPRAYSCLGKGSGFGWPMRSNPRPDIPGPIAIVGACEARPGPLSGVCLGDSGPAETGGIHDCYTSADPSNPGDHYDEVITVHMKKLAEVCGNSICERDEGRDATCPSDCHPDGWAHSFATILSAPADYVLSSTESYANQVSRWSKTSAVGPDGTIVLAGITPSAIDLGGAVDLGGGVLDAGPDGTWHGTLAKYGSNGEYLWGKRFGPLGENSMPGSVVVGRDGSIGVALTDRSNGSSSLWLGTFTPDGEPVWSRSFEGEENNENRVRALAIDDVGNLIVAGSYTGRLRFGTTALPDVGLLVPSKNLFVLKVSSQGVPEWAVSFEGGPLAAENEATALAVDREGNALLGLPLSYGPATGLWKLSAASGEVLWSRRGGHEGVATDVDGNVYATLVLTAGDDGAPDDLYDFVVPPDAHVDDLLVVKYAATDGTPLQVRGVTSACRRVEAPCGRRFDGLEIALDDAGTVVVSVFNNNSGVNFGAGSMPDNFVAAFSSELEPRWVKHMSLLLDGTLHGLQVDGGGRVVMSGTFSGLMLVDDRLLVSNSPRQRGVANTFLAAFAVPSAYDVTPPTITVGHMPKPVTLEAASPAGVEVFFLPPTSIDEGHAGVNVSCSARSNAIFPIGVTQVDCIATDPLGNSTSALFDVRVVDHLGPAFKHVPAPIMVEASGPDGAAVVFAPPSAVDLVDGSRPVTCAPASGSVFPLGSTKVTCAASDASGNYGHATFGVSVVDTIPPVLTVPAPLAATATSSQGAVVTYAASANDAIGGAVTPTCSQPSGSVFAPGTTVVTCRASDASGNATERSFSVNVTYAWSGVLKPVYEGAAFKLGRTIPVQFRLMEASAGITDLRAKLTAIYVGPPQEGELSDAPVAQHVTGEMVFAYDERTGKYVYTLATASLSTGYWDLHFDLGDGVARSVQIFLWR